jgi:tetratricopeptide (TPR) repeat protein
LGNYYRKKCEYQRAAEQWEKCLEKDSCTVYMLSRLGDAYRNLGKYEDAERSYLKGLEKGYDKFNLLGIMKLWCQMGRLKDVCDCYDELFHREGTDTRFAIEAGQLLMQYEKSEMALEFYRHAQQLQINSPEAVAVIDTCILQLKDSHRTHLKFTPKTEHAPPLV